MRAIEPMLSARAFWWPSHWPCMLPVSPRCCDAWWGCTPCRR